MSEIVYFKFSQTRLIGNLFQRPYRLRCTNIQISKRTLHLQRVHACCCDHAQTKRSPVNTSCSWECVIFQRGKHPLVRVNAHFDPVTKWTAHRSARPQLFLLEETKRQKTSGRTTPSHPVWSVCLLQPPLRYQRIRGRTSTHRNKRDKRILWTKFGRRVCFPSCHFRPALEKTRCGLEGPASERAQLSACPCGGDNLSLRALQKPSLRFWPSADWDDQRTRLETKPGGREAGMKSGIGSVSATWRWYLEGETRRYIYIPLVLLLRNEPCGGAADASKPVEGPMPKSLWSCRHKARDSAIWYTVSIHGTWGCVHLWTLRYAALKCAHLTENNDRTYTENRN